MRLVRRRDKLYTAAAKIPQKNPFVAQCKSVATDIPKMESVGCGMFRNSYNNCAGGKTGTTKVIAASSRKAQPNIATADMFKGYNPSLSLLL